MTTFKYLNFALFSTCGNTALNWNTLLSKTSGFNPKCLDNSLVILDGLDFSLAAGCGLRSASFLRELSAAWDAVNICYPVESQLVSSPPVLCPSYLVLA